MAARIILRGICVARQDRTALLNPPNLRLREEGGGAEAGGFKRTFRSRQLVPGWNVGLKC